MPARSVPDTIWSSFQTDQLTDRYGGMLTDLKNTLTSLSTPSPPTPALPTPAPASTLTPRTGLPSLDALVVPFAPTAAQLGQQVASGAMPDLSATAASAPSASPSASLPSLQSLPALGSLVAAAAPSVAPSGVRQGPHEGPPTLAGRQPGLTSGPPPAAPTPTGGLESYTRQKAQSLGIDPDTAIRVGNTEGGFADPTRQNTGGAPAYGPYQMYIGGPSNPGLGDELLARGIDPRKPENVYRAIDFALEHAAKNGWGAFQGAAAHGIGAFQGIGTRPSGAPAPVRPATTPSSQQAPQAAGGGGLDVNGIVDAYKNTAYTYGGPGGRTQGFGAPSDCSGFVAAVYANQYGLNLVPHTDGAYNQLRQSGASEVAVKDARPGDVVFYMGAGTGGAITHHMGIYAGDGNVLDDSVSGQDGVHVRDVGHAGQYVILRDPRLNQQTPTTASVPPPIQPSGVAEASGGEKVSNRELQAQAAQSQGGPAWTNAQDSGTGTTVLSAPLSMRISSTPTAQTSSSSDPGDLMLRQPLSQPTSGADSTPTWQDSQVEPAPPPTPAPTASSGPPWQTVPNEDVTSYGPSPQPNGGLGIVDTSGPEQGPAAPFNPLAGQQPPQPGELPQRPGSMADLPEVVQAVNRGEAVNPFHWANQVSDASAEEVVRQIGMDPSSVPGMTAKFIIATVVNPVYWQGGAFSATAEGIAMAGRPILEQALPAIAEKFGAQTAGRLSTWLAGQGAELGAEVVGGAAAGAVTQPEDPGLGALAGGGIPVLGAAARPVGRAIRGGLARAGEALDANATRVAALDAERAGQGAVAAPGVFGVAPPEAGPAAEAVGRQRFVPPEVRMQTTPNMELPDDPRFAAAVEAHGGRITDQGAEVYTTRFQGEAAAGRTATRGGVFAEVVPEGGRGSYGRSADNPNAVGGSQEIPPTKTLYRKPIVLDSEPGSAQGFDQAMQRLGIEHPPSAGRIDQEIYDAQRAGPPGSPARAQALKDLVSRYGGDPSTIDDLLAIRADTQAESQWAIKENIVAGNARRQGVDGVFTVKPGESNWNAVNQHPLVVEAQKAHQEASRAYDAAYSKWETESGTGFSARDYLTNQDTAIKSSPEVRAAYDRMEQAGKGVEQAQQQAEKLLSAPKISEVFDVQQGKNPTPGAPNPRIAENKQALDAAELRLGEVKRELFGKFNPATGYVDAPTPAEAAVLKAEFDRLPDEIARLKAERSVIRQEPQSSGQPGYSLHPDLVRPTAPEPGSTTAAGMAGVTPVPVRGEGDRLARVNAMLSQGAASAVSGGVGAATADQLGDPNDPNRRLKGFLAGALIPALGTRGAAALARRVGARALPEAEGALATFGASPHYKPPAPGRVQAEARRGPRDGEHLNRRVSAPPSDVPRTVVAATASTDDRAGMRWAEDLLSAAAGSPRMRENDPSRPSTQSRVNRGGIADQRIQRDLEPAIVEAGRAGLHDELPQYLRDVHQKDILDEFYTRGKQEAIDAGEQKAQDQLDRVDAVVKARLNAAEQRATTLEQNGQQARADSVRRIAQNNASQTMARAQQVADSLKATPQQIEDAGVQKMRTREGGNVTLNYEAIDARLQGQEQRLKASGKWDQLQQSAQAFWDHNAETRQSLVDSGEMDPADAAYYAQTYPHYVPTQPISHLDARAGGAVVSGGGPRVSRGTQKAVHALEDVGTSGDLLNPIVATRMATIRAERAIGRNNVASSFAQMMDDALQASPGTMGVGSEHRTFLGGGADVSFMANGKPQTMSVPKTVADGLEAAAKMSADPGTPGRLWKKAMGVVTSAMTAGRASFLPVNLARDAQDYAIRTAALEGGPQQIPAVMGTWMDEAGKAVSDIFRAQLTPRGAAGFGIGAAAGAAQGDENTTVSERLRHAAEGGVAGTFLLGANKVRPTGAAQEFLARGGGSGGLSAHLGENQRWYRDVMRDGGAPIRSLGDAARYLGDWAGDIGSLQGIKGINERTELISRTAAMRRAEKVRGLDPTEAMIAGRDASYDPDRAGTVSRAVNGIVPFFNATVQNAAQTARLFRQNPVAAAATMTATVAPVMLLTEAWNRSDPQRAAVYDDVPQYLKDSGLVVVTPWAGSDSRGDRPNYIWIPTGIATPFVAGMRRAMQDVADIPGLEPSSGTVGAGPDASSVEKWANVLTTTAQMFSPIRGDTAASALSNLVPQGVKQGLELGINRDLYRGQPIVTGPADERASALSRGVADVANAAGRAIGNDWLQERRPSEVEHIVQAFPAQSDIVSGVSDMLAPSGYKRAEDRPVANEPFLGGIASRFIRDTGGANLQRAQDARLPDVIRPALEQAGLPPSTVGTVPSTYKQAPLTHDEQVRWQNLTNTLLPREVLATTRSSEWRAPDANKEQLVRDAMARAREAAAARAMPRLDDQEIERRKRADAAMKAG